MSVSAERENNSELESAKHVKNPFIHKLSNLEALNFMLTNRIPRNLSTRLMGKFSRIRNPWVAKLSIAVWKAFVDDLRLDEAKKSSFESMHDCFTRQLKPGARDFAPDPKVVSSPCDAVIGAHGKIKDGQLFQIKGFPYDLADLLGNTIDFDKYRNGTFVTLRIKSSMYHRFHAPLDCKVREIHYISGDTWNVNPVALKRVEKLFCKNERAVLDLDLDKPDQHIALVPVAAILVASMKFHGLEDALDMEYQGPNRLPCDLSYAKGEEMGYFQHGSTIVVLANEGFELHEAVKEGSQIEAGMPILKATN